MVTVSANVPGVAKSDLTPIKLAHPLGNPADLERLGIPLDTVLNTGDTVKVTGDHARTLIVAGYGYQVDPESPEQVATALGLDDDDQVPSPVGAAEGQQAGEGTAADAGGSGSATRGASGSEDDNQPDGQGKTAKKAAAKSDKD